MLQGPSLVVADRSIGHFPGCLLKSLGVEPESGWDSQAAASRIRFRELHVYFRNGMVHLGAFEKLKHTSWLMNGRIEGIIASNACGQCTMHNAYWITPCSYGSQVSLAYIPSRWLDRGTPKHGTLMGIHTCQFYCDRLAGHDYEQWRTAVSIRSAWLTFTRQDVGEADL